MMQRQGPVTADGASAATAATPSAPRPAPVAAPRPDRQPIPERSAEYMREVRGELHKVAWPARTEVFNYTVVVLVAVVLLTAFIFGLDYGFAKGIIYLFHK
jgi:preprotein translocase subunit SecE